MGDSADPRMVVVRGGKLDIRMKVGDPSGSLMYDKLLFSNIDESTGAIVGTLLKKGTSITANRDGTYSFCFDNTMSRWTAKVVDFELTIRSSRLSGSPSSSQDELNRVKRGEEPEHVSKMKGMTERIHASLSKVVTKQMLHRDREQRHMETIDTNNGRVGWLTGIEVLVVIVIAVGQLLLVRHFVQLPGGPMSALLPTTKGGSGARFGGSSGGGGGGFGSGMGMGIGGFGQSTGGVGAKRPGMGGGIGGGGMGGARGGVGAGGLAGMVGLGGRPSVQQQQQQPQRPGPGGLGAGGGSGGAVGVGGGFRGFGSTTVPHQRRGV